MRLVGTCKKYLANYNYWCKIHIVFAVYGTLNRLKFFWPYLSNKDPQTVKAKERTPFHFVAYHNLIDVADFMLEELKQDSEFEYLKNVKIPFDIPFLNCHLKWKWLPDTHLIIAYQMPDVVKLKAIWPMYLLQQGFEPLHQENLRSKHVLNFFKQFLWRSKEETLPALWALLDP